MCLDIEKFAGFLIENDKLSWIERIREIIAIGEDASGLIHELLDKLSEEEVGKCYQVFGKSEEAYSSDQTEILSFLSILEKEGLISQYWTLSNIHQAIEFNRSEASNLTGSILWLVDRDFARIGDSHDAGLQLANTLIMEKNSNSNFVYIVSGVGDNNDPSDDEDGIEDEFDRIIASIVAEQATQSLIYFIRKRLLFSGKNDRIAKSLARGFKRKESYEFIDIYRKCLIESVMAASENIFSIKHGTLNYLLEEKVAKNGESCIDFMTRLIHILLSEQYNQSIAAVIKDVSERVCGYQELCAIIEDKVGDQNKQDGILKKIREMEMYNSHINTMFMELSTGDVYMIGSCPYILISQACDVFLREGGARKLQTATLLPIENEAHGDYVYKLSCFRNYSQPSVVLDKPIHVPFEVLDLCVLNDDGVASIGTALIENGMENSFDAHSVNFNKRILAVIERIKTVYENKTLLDKHIKMNGDISNDDFLSAISDLVCESPLLTEYTFEGERLVYPIQRICRLNELTTLDIADKYGNALARVGHPFDFLKGS